MRSLEKEVKEEEKEEGKDEEEEKKKTMTKKKKSEEAGVPMSRSMSLYGQVRNSCEIGYLGVSQGQPHNTIDILCLLLIPRNSLVI